jgi:hypothetical protein
MAVNVPDAGLVRMGIKVKPVAEFSLVCVSENILIKDSSPRIKSPRSYTVKNVFRVLRVKIISYVRMHNHWGIHPNDVFSNLNWAGRERIFLTDGLREYSRIVAIPNFVRWSLSGLFRDGIPANLKFLPLSW